LHLLCVLITLNFFNWSFLSCLADTYLALSLDSKLFCSGTVSSFLSEVLILSKTLKRRINVYYKDGYDFYPCSLWDCNTQVECLQIPSTNQVLQSLCNSIKNVSIESPKYTWKTDIPLLFMVKHADNSDINYQNIDICIHKKWKPYYVQMLGRR
jgi:hypothetical protein